MARRRLRLRQTGKANLAIAVVALVVGILGLAIAFAVVTHNLVINGTTTIQGPEWKIRFASQSSYSTGGARITSRQVDDQTVAYDVVFTGPNQSASASFAVANESLMNAKIAAITYTGDSEMAARHITHKLSYTDGNVVAVGDELLARSSRNLHLRLDYTATTQAEFIADSGTRLGMTILVQYAQGE